MDAALALQRRDALTEAEPLYRAALAIDPGAPDALHMLGTICYRTGRLDEGYALLRDALERTGWRIPMIRYNFALLLSAMLGSAAAVEAMLSGDEELRVRIEADGRRCAAALGVRYAGPGAASADGHSRGGSARVLIVDQAVPAPDRDSGSSRLVAIMRILRGLGCALTFVGRGVEFGGPGVDTLRALDIEVLCQPDVWSIPQFLAARGGEFDLVWVSRHHVAAECVAAIRRCAPQALFVLDTVDLHFLRERREAGITGDPEALRRAASTRERELASIRDADVTLVVSESERRRLRGLVPAADVRVVSNVLAVGPAGPGFRERRGAVFVGAFNHRPNVDAIGWYVREVWPYVLRRMPDARTFVIGSDMPESVRNLAGRGIDAVGHVPDLEPYLHRCKVSIAPLRYGAGVKGKISAAQAAGLPVVATSIGVEGMHLECGRDVLVADSAPEFADAIVRLHDDESLWNRLAAGGRENVARHFSAEAARPTLARLIAAAAARRPARAAS